MKPQQNEDLKVPDQYFEDVKLHWRKVLEVEDNSNTEATKKSLNEAPRTRDIKKKTKPVLCETGPKRCFKNS